MNSLLTAWAEGALTDAQREELSALIETPGPLQDRLLALLEAPDALTWEAPTDYLLATGEEEAEELEGLGDEVPLPGEFDDSMFPM